MIVGDIKSLRKAQTYSNYVEKPGTKQESTIMQFFDQSDWERKEKPLVNELVEACLWEALEKGQL